MYETLSAKRADGTFIWTLPRYGSKRSGNDFSLFWVACMLAICDRYKRSQSQVIQNSPKNHDSFLLENSCSCDRRYDIGRKIARTWCLYGRIYRSVQSCSASRHDAPGFLSWIRQPTLHLLQKWCSINIH